MTWLLSILLAVLGGLVWLADRTSTLSPDFLTEVVLFALSATNVTMLVALAFVLARNVIKSIMEKISIRRVSYQLDFRIAQTGRFLPRNSASSGS